MAGDWIKWEKGLVTKPEVDAIRTNDRWAPDDDEAIRQCYAKSGPPGVLNWLVEHGRPCRRYNAIQARAWWLGIGRDGSIGPSKVRRVVERECSVCGGTFIPSRHTSSTCGDACKRVQETKRVAARRRARANSGRVPDSLSTPVDETMVRALAARDRGDHTLIQKILAVVQSSPP